ncbi:MAG: hypothetical protein AAFX06_31880 [Planctomycetota bacterium]
MRIAQNGDSALAPVPRSTAGSRDVESRLKELQATMGRVSQQLGGPAPTNSNQPSPQPLFAEPASPPGTLDSEANDSVSAIRKQLRLLRTLRAQSATREPPESKPKEEPALSPLPDMMEEPTPRDPNLEAIEESLDSVPDATTPAAESMEAPPNMEATEIVSSPVNSLALGQSLYRTGNYEAALKAFRNVSNNTLDDADRTWLELMKAMCHRRMAKTSDSDAILRTLANEKSSEYPVSAARWWLKHSEAVSDSRPFFEQTSASVDTLLERAKKYDQSIP